MSQKKKKTTYTLIFAGILLLVLLATVLYFRYSVKVGDHRYLVRNGTVDLRDVSLTTNEADRLHEQLPGVHLLWSVPLGGLTFDSNSNELSLSSLSEDDLPNLAYFDVLRVLEFSSDVNGAILSELNRLYPNIELHSVFPLGGKTFSWDEQSISLSEKVSAEELESALPHFPRLKKLSLQKNDLSVKEQLRLSEKFPAVSFDWDISVLGTEYSSSSTTLQFSGQTFSETEFDALLRALPLFRRLKKLDVRGCGLSADQIVSLCASAGKVNVAWDTELYGVQIDSDDQIVDLNEIPLENVDELEALLPCFSQLEKVEMCLCGISDEEMDALNKRHEDVEFVWIVHMRRFGVRTDATYFTVWNCPYAFSPDGDKDNMDESSLRYCTKMIALDLGGMGTACGNVSFLTGMNDLRYLVLSKGSLYDYPEIADLPNLELLEMFLCTISTLEFLRDNDTVRFLNIGSCHYLHDKAGTLDVLKSMKKLERLLVTDDMFYQWQLDELMEAKPDLDLIVTTNVVDPRWRGAREFFDMRDALHMYYIDGGGNSVDINPYTGEPNKYPTTNPFVYSNYRRYVPEE